MAGETNITIVGNLTADPDLKFVPSGKAVSSFTVASTPRMFDKDSGQWKDGDTLFMRCSVWDKYAENAAESLVKGDRVVVTGRLGARSYDKDGQKVTVVELQVEELGAALRFRSFPHRSKADMPTRSSGAAAEPDPWATPAPGGAARVEVDEPPF